MFKIGRTTTLLAAALCVALIVATIYRPAPAPDIEGLLEAGILARLNETVSVASDFRREEGPWILDCGTVVGADGSAWVSSDVSVESADYCALLRRADRLELVELDIGATDMPAMDWVAEYDLPPGLLSSR